MNWIDLSQVGTGGCHL